MAPERIPKVLDELDELRDDVADLRGDVRALTLALKTAVALLAGNGALNLADLLR